MSWMTSLFNRLYSQPKIKRTQFDCRLNLHFSTGEINVHNSTQTQLFFVKQIIILDEKIQIGACDDVKKNLLEK